MANNRMYLGCPVCADSKSVMLAKYYPSSGWFSFPECFDLSTCFTQKLDGFFEAHRHDSQWGNGFILEFEIEPDFPMENPPKFAVSETEPFPRINTSNSDSKTR